MSLVPPNATRLPRQPALATHFAWLISHSLLLSVLAVEVDASPNSVCEAPALTEEVQFVFEFNLEATTYSSGSPS